MKNVLWKEWREVLAWQCLSLVVVIVLVLAGEPLMYRSWAFGPAVSPDFGGLMAVPTLVCLLMGLSAYSRETARQTLAFTLSRPVQWWWLPASKTMAGAAVCAASALAGGGVYLVVQPAVYRPFTTLQSMALGVLSLFGFTLGAFILGLTLSALAPGLSLSFAIFIAVLGGFSMLEEWWGGTMPNGMLAAVLACALIVALLVSVRPPLALDRAGRRKAWVAIMGCAVLGLTAYSAVIRSQTPPPPSDAAYESPDSRNTAYSSGFYSHREPGEIWIGTENNARRVDRAPRVSPIAWSPDSRTLYYAAGTIQDMRLMAADEDKGWRPRFVCNLPSAAKRAADSRSYVENYAGTNDPSWSPSGSRLAFKQTVWLDPSTMVMSVMVIDLHHRSARRMEQRRSMRDCWWVDDYRLAELKDNAKIRIIQVP